MKFQDAPVGQCTRASNTELNCFFKEKQFSGENIKPSYILWAICKNNLQSFIVCCRTSFRDEQCSSDFTQLDLQFETRDEL